MTNYTKNVACDVKDGLTTGDPDKLILGTQLDDEFDEIAAAIATKYDSGNIATQAQAEAEASNTVLMTPQRVAQWADYNAGAVGDLQALTDPNAARVLIWNDSTNAVEWGTYVSLSSAIDHDLLLNWVADKHLAHSSISITAGSGLSGGGTIAASRTLALDINSLTTDASPDTAADFIPFYDTSEGANNKVLISSLAGQALGDAAFYTAGQSLSAGTEATVVYTTTDYDSLERGTFSTSTGIYTAGASGARIQVACLARVSSIAVGGTLVINGYHNSTAKGYGRGQNYADGTATELWAMFLTTVTLAAGDTFTCKATASSAATLTSGQQYNRISIVELA